MTTRWQQSRLRALARQMVNLERVAQRCESRGDTERAGECWRRRETVQWLRSLLLRDSWAERVRQ